jgi:tRNA pseudouridine65 synthase
MQSVIILPASFPPDLPLLYADADLVAVAKPSGLLVHRTKIAAQDTRFALQLVRDALGGEHVYAAHRLDRGTSGVLIFARSREAARALGEAFAARRVQKRYLAIVRGHPPEALVLDRPLAPFEQREKPEQEALTRVRTLATVTLPEPSGRYATSRYALVEAAPETGRTHQIRRHLAGADFPIIGDHRHGDYRHNRRFRERYGTTLLLHAASLTLPHPATSETLTLKAHLPSGFLRICDAFGWAVPV